MSQLGREQRLGVKLAVGVANRDPAEVYRRQARVIPHGRVRADLHLPCPTAIPLVHGPRGPGGLRIGEYLLERRTARPFLARRPFALAGARRRWSIQGSLGVDVADEVDVGGELGQDALATVGAIAGDDDVVVREPGGNQGNQFDGQLRPRAVVGIGFGFGLGLALLAFGDALSVPIEAHGDGEGEDLARRPEWVHDDEAQHDPIVSPTDEGLGPAGDERIMVHAGAIEREAAFTAEGIVHGPEQGSARSEDRDDEFGQMEAQDIHVPGGMTKEAMETGPMPVVHVAAGEDDVGHIAMAVR